MSWSGICRIGAQNYASTLKLSFGDAAARILIKAASLSYKHTTMHSSDAK